MLGIFLYELFLEYQVILLLRILKGDDAFKVSDSSKNSNLSCGRSCQRELYLSQNYTPNAFLILIIRIHNIIIQALNNTEEIEKKVG